MKREVNLGVSVGGGLLTAADVERAAEVLEQVSKLYEFAMPEFSEWSAQTLLGELPHIKAALESEELLDEIVNKLVSVMFGGYNETSLADGFKEVLRGYEIDRPLFPEKQTIEGVERC